MGMTFTRYNNVYSKFPELIYERSRAVKSSVFVASVYHDAGLEWLQGSYHTD